MKTTLFLIALFLAAALPAQPARANCLLCSCSVSTNPFSFGAFAPILNSALDGAGSVDIDCIGVSTSVDSMTLSLNAGGSGAFGARRMISGANTLSYNLYTDASRTTIWGDGTGGSSTLLVQNQLSLLVWSTNVPIYGRIPAAPLTKPGNYSDTIIVTVQW